MSRKTIHIVADFDGTGGGGAHARALRDLLAPHADVQCWTETPATSVAIRDYRPIQLYGGAYPYGGTLVVLGPHCRLTPWVKRCAADRIVLVCNASEPELLFSQIAMLRSLNLPKPDVSFVSQRLKDTIGIEGAVNISPILAEKYTHEGRPFRAIVGRHGRDTLLKHHPQDPLLFQQLAYSGIDVRVLGGHCLKPFLEAAPSGIELLAYGSEPVPEFLSTLNIYYHNPRPDIADVAPRAVLEAMAAACAVVVSSRTGCTDWIKNGENGLLVNSQEEAFDAIIRLAKAPELRESMGEAARKTALQLSGPDARERVGAWYLGCV